MHYKTFICKFWDSFPSSVGNNGVEISNQATMYTECRNNCTFLESPNLCNEYNTSMMSYDMMSYLHYKSVHVFNSCDWDYVYVSICKRWAMNMVEALRFYGWKCDYKLLITRDLVVCSYSYLGHYEISICKFWDFMSTSVILSHRDYIGNNGVEILTRCTEYRNRNNWWPKHYKQHKQHKEPIDFTVTVWIWKVLSAIPSVFQHTTMVYCVCVHINALRSIHLEFYRVCRTKLHRATIWYHQRTNRCT